MPAEYTLISRVAYYDTDGSTRIHWTAPLRWAEAAECELMRSLDALELWGRFPRRQVEVEYIKALRFDDLIEVRLRVAQVGTTSVTFAWDVMSRGEVAVRGRHIAVLVDAGGTPTELPTALREQLDPPES